MAECRASGVLDTCFLIDYELLDPATLPVVPEITSVTMAEPRQGVAMAKNAVARAARSERRGAATISFEPLPFDCDAAARYGTLVALTVLTRRDPRPRRLDLMIAAIASSRQLPLYTRNEKDFRGLEDMVEIIGV